MRIVFRQCVKIGSLADGEVVVTAGDFMIGGALCSSGYGRIINETTQVCDEFSYDKVGAECDSGADVSSLAASAKRRV